ncbi:MAG: hypothetical protein C0594_14080, partial [Marinilabiliales bacterium]
MRLISFNVKFHYFYQNVSQWLHREIERMTPTVIVFLRQDYKKSDNTHPIYIRIIINRRKKDISLNISTKLNCWNPTNCRIRRTDPQYLHKNRMIDLFETKANDILFKMTVEGKSISFEEFLRRFKTSYSLYNSFYEFIESEIPQLQAKFSDGTIRTYNTQISKLKKFRPRLSFDDIDINFIKAYEHYMIAKLKNNSNTIKKSLSFIKQVINKAITANLVKENPFKNYHIGKIEGNRQYLSMQELDTLMKLYRSGSIKTGQKNVLRYFLFSCYTGLRYHDVYDLKYKHIDHNYIRIDMHKTGKLVEIPIVNKAMELLPDQDDKIPEMKVFKVLSNQPTNRYIKDIMTAVGIKKSISFHCAR